MELSVNKTGCNFKSKHVEISASSSQASVNIPPNSILANEYLNCYSILCIVPAALLLGAYKVVKALT